VSGKVLVCLFALIVGTAVGLGLWRLIAIEQKQKEAERAAIVAQVEEITSGMRNYVEQANQLIVENNKLHEVNDMIIAKLEAENSKLRAELERARQQNSPAGE